MICCVFNPETRPNACTGGWLPLLALPESKELIVLAGDTEEVEVEGDMDDKELIALPLVSDVALDSLTWNHVLLG